MLNYTGHPFVDVGIAAMVAFNNKRHPSELTPEDFAKVADYIEHNYVRPPLRGHLTMAFTSNAWFIQDAYNPDKPGLSAEKRAERQAARDLWAQRHIRQWANPERGNETCIFTGLPTVAQELSNKLAPGRIGRAQMPLLQGDDTINFFTGGSPGLPISPEALLALQFMPLGCAKCGVGLLAVHADNDELTFHFAKTFLEANRRDIVLAQAAQEDKLPSSQRSLKTLLIETLSQIEKQRVRTERRTQQAASITAYNYSNGKTPQLNIIPLPMQVMSFLQTVETPKYRDTWNAIVASAWQHPKNKPSRNHLYEDLFELPKEAARFVRTYFLRIADLRRFDDDPRKSYSLQRERELVSWPLVELFLKEVMSMDEEQIERIRSLADKLADYTRHQGGKRFFRAFFTTQKTFRFLDLMMKTNIDYVKFKKGQDVLFNVEGYIELFMDGIEVMKPNWWLARDLVLIRMVEQLKDWIANNPDALSEEDLQAIPDDAKVPVEV